MKYIITESQLNKKILDIVLKQPEFQQELNEFDCSTMEWSEGVWVEEICFMENSWDTPVFSYFPYPSDDSEYKKNEVFSQDLDYLPALKVDEEISKTLNNFLSDKWKKPFQEWFEKKFEYPVKTFFD